MRGILSVCDCGWGNEDRVDITEDTKFLGVVARIESLRTNAAYSVSFSVIVCFAFLHIPLASKNHRDMVE